MNERSRNERNSERSSEKQTAIPWRVPVAVDDVADTGQHFGLTADQDVRAAVARIAGLRELPRLEASFDVTTRGAALHVVGRISATVGQNCVVTLEPLASEIEEDIDLLFVPQRPADSTTDDAEPAEPTKTSRPERAWNEPEPLIDGTVDLGALATEFLILGLDPYPRKLDAIFEPPQDVAADEGPFAALAKLTKGQDDR
jgi:hypothetical protein